MYNTNYAQPETSTFIRSLTGAVYTKGEEYGEIEINQATDLLANSTFPLLTPPQTTSINTTTTAHKYVTADPLHRHNTTTTFEPLHTTSSKQPKLKMKVYLCLYRKIEPTN